MPLAEYWVGRYQYKTGEHHFDVYGTTVRRAMQSGQMTAVIMRINRFEHIPVLDEMVRTPRGGVHSTVSTNIPKLHESLGPVLKWVQDEGLKWRIGFDVIGGVYRDIYSEWADFIVYWEPQLKCGLNLMDFWLRTCTVKCLDDGLYAQWYSTTRRAMESGQKYAILCTLFAGTDFVFEDTGIQSVDVRILSSFDLTVTKGDLHLTTNKFESVFKFAVDNGLQWFVVLDYEHQDWAYLAVSAEIR